LGIILEKLLKSSSEQKQKVSLKPLTRSADVTKCSMATDISVLPWALL